MRARIGTAARNGTTILLLALSPMLLAAGCRNRALEQTRQETREAKATINKLSYNLTAAQNEIATLRAELKVVRQTRDELQRQLSQLAHDRDQAATFAREAQEAINRLTAQEGTQNSMTVALQRQNAEMKTLIEEQQRLIEQLHKGAAVEPVDPTKPADPNQTP
ncbi:MAG: hypothetical protein FJ280_07950 [Planctomycetes bacterium]|nr:hypothetical protein [Planctomycetota bacterium]